MKELESGSGRRGQEDVGKDRKSLRSDGQLVLLPSLLNRPLQNTAQKKPEEMVIWWDRLGWESLSLCKGL